jgi:hypothetical protein
MTDDTATSMYFAVEPLAPDFIEKLTEAIQDAKAKNPDLLFYAVVDAAFEHARPRIKRTTWKDEAWSLYEDMTTQTALKDAAPHLVPLSDDPNDLQYQLVVLRKVGNGLPMMSFIGTTIRPIEFPIKPAELMATFKPFFEVTAGDKQRFLLRFADTRILPVLDSILRDDNIAGWRHGITHWWLPDRTGKLISLPEYPNNDRPFDSAQDCLSLSAKSFNQLTDAGESDAILDAIAEQNADLLKGKQPAAAHAVIQRLKEKIAEFHIDNFRDVVMFCTTALSASERFYSNPKFKALLTSGAWTPGKLGEAFMTVDDDAWTENEAMNLFEVKQEKS